MALLELGVSFAIARFQFFKGFNQGSVGRQNNIQLKKRCEFFESCPFTDLPDQLVEKKDKLQSCLMEKVCQ